MKTKNNVYNVTPKAYYSTTNIVMNGNKGDMQTISIQHVMVICVFNVQYMFAKGTTFLEFSLFIY